METTDTRTEHNHRKHVATCETCGNSWCERCDPAPSALCHWCHGRGRSTAPYARRVNGTTYKAGTPIAVVTVLESARASGARLRLFYGDTETGRDWGGIHDTTGRIGRSMGPIKIPIMLHHHGSLGGGGILDDCIVRIRYSNRKDGGELYRHPLYHFNADDIHPDDLRHFT